LSELSRRLPATGVTGFLPTIISSPLEAVEEFVLSASEAPAPGARILGAHVEGPFLNSHFHGAHDPRRLLLPTPANVDRLLRRPPRMLTLAPELPGALPAIRRLRRAGILVSAGHSGADYDQGLAAIAAGVRFGTHLYNAMQPFHHRRPGLTAALLADRRVTVGLIADGEHVHPAACDLAVRMKGWRRVALTTDQTAAAGVEAGAYELGGREVKSDGQTVRLDDGTLAGSVATMDALVRRLAAVPGVGRDRALAMASAVPARALGDPCVGRVAAGASADLVVLDAELKVRLTLVDGRVVFRA
jgi:N-acetylglucosamine-6-phosphate deacetylase